MSPIRVRAVTGANKGIGLETVKLLARREPSSKIVLLARDESRGKEAVANLNAEHPNVIFIQCDIVSDASISRAVKELQSLGEVSLFVNNAGFAYKGASTEVFSKQARDSIDINYYGTKRVCEEIHAAFPSCRIVNVASMSGQSAARGLRDDRREGLIASTEKLAANVGIAEVTAFMEEFVSKSGEEDNGFPKSAYGMSKLGLIMLTEVFGRTMEMASCCPGWCKTDMAGWEKPPLTAHDGALRVVDLCFKEPFVRGAFYREMNQANPYATAE